MIIVKLTTANMGPNATEEDYDAWMAYVCTHIDEAVGFTVDVVDMFSVLWDAGSDRVAGATEEQKETIQRWLSNEGWEAFCTQGKEGGP